MHSSDEIYQSPNSNLENPKIASRYELASRWQRLGAAIIDVLISILPLVGIYFLMAQLFEDTVLYWEENNPVLFDAVFGVAYIGLFCLVNIYLLIKRGQTVGKMILGIAIVSYRTNLKATKTQILVLRFGLFTIISYVPVIGGFISLINILFIFGEEKRCLHDLAADTKVVQVR